MLNESNGFIASCIESHDRTKPQLTDSTASPAAGRGTGCWTTAESARTRWWCRGSASPGEESRKVASAGRRRDDAGAFRDFRLFWLRYMAATSGLIRHLETSSSVKWLNVWTVSPLKPLQVNWITTLKNKKRKRPQTQAVSFPLCFHGNYIIYLVNILSSSYFINQSLSWLIKSYSRPSL